jgi:hypothetical protein
MARDSASTRVLDWQPRSREEAVISMAESMVRLGMI